MVNPFVEGVRHFAGSNITDSCEENTMQLSSLEDLLVEELKDLYSAENQLLKAIPKMAKAATSKELKAGFEKHFKQTQGHVERLEQVCELMDVSPKGKKCKAMEGLIEESADVIEEDAEPEVKDAQGPQQVGRDY
jgi:ferritin-like metal-binding protein YciE